MNQETNRTTSNCENLKEDKVLDSKESISNNKIDVENSEIEQQRPEDFLIKDVSEEFVEVRIEEDKFSEVKLRKILKGKVGADDRFWLTKNECGKMKTDLIKSPPMLETVKNKNQTDVPITLKRRRDHSDQRLASDEKEPYHKRTVTQENKGLCSDRVRVVRIAIVKKDHPSQSISSEEEFLIQRALLKTIGKINGKGPQFKRTYLEQGAMIIVCQDNYSADWLKESVPTVTPWEGCELLVLPANQVLRSAKVSLWLPEVSKDTPSPEILKILHVQNQDIKTGSWKVLNRTVEEQDLTMVAEIDEESFKILQNRKHKLHLGLGQVPFKIFRSSRSNKAGGGTDDVGEGNKSSQLQKEIEQSPSDNS